MTRADLVAVLEDARERAHARIDAAYWAFTRTARGRPPILVVPEAYAERSLLDARLRALRRPDDRHPSRDRAPSPKRAINRGMTKRTRAKAERPMTRRETAEAEVRGEIADAREHTIAGGVAMAEERFAEFDFEIEVPIGEQGDARVLFWRPGDGIRRGLFMRVGPIGPLVSITNLSPADQLAAVKALPRLLDSCVARARRADAQRDEIAGALSSFLAYGQTVDVQR